MARRPCCCDGCCATAGTLAADVVMGGSLPGMTEVLIDPISEDGCTGSTDGVYDGDTQTYTAMERPTTGIPGTPKYGINALMAGEWIWANYDFVGRVNVVDGYDFDCYYLCNFDGMTIVPTVSCAGLLSEVTPISGSLELIEGNEPNRWPYWLKLEYWVYEDSEGDCILRIGAGVTTGFEHTPLTSAFNTTVNYLQEQSWPHTDSAYKYSDHNPCGEDIGVLPVPGDSTIGEWTDGGRVELEDGPVTGPVGVVGSGANGKYTESDLQTDDDPDVTAIPAGAFGISIAWEINLTDDAITDLADLPTTVLTLANAQGTYSSIRGSITAFTGGQVAAIEAIGFSKWGESLSLSAGSAVRQTTTGPTTQQYSIVNGGGGGHSCYQPPDPGECTTGKAWTDGGMLQIDQLYWEVESGVVGDTVEIYPFDGLEITIRQPTP